MRKHENRFWRNVNFAVWFCFASVAAGAALALDIRVDAGERVGFRIGISGATGEISLELDTAQRPKVEISGDGADVALLTQETTAEGWERVVVTTRNKLMLRSAGYDGDVLQVQVGLLEGLDRRNAAEVTTEATPSPLPMIVLDPGHGGIDSGAVSEDIRESDLMLAFANELSERLVRSGRVRVNLTRSDDSFLRLSERVRLAQVAGGAAFISLHADALTEGRAQGAAVFTLSKDASSETAAELVGLHERSDLLSGDDLKGTADDVASILVDLSQRATAPKSNALAEAIVEGLSANEDALRRRARQSADFGVLKAPDIPSILIELGFMSDERDLQNLNDPEWRAAMADAIAAAIIKWVNENVAH